MEANGEHCPFRGPCPRQIRDHGGAAVGAVKKLGGAVITAAAGTGVAVYGWAAAFVITAALAATVFVVWWVLSDSDRSTRLRDILTAVWGSRR